MSNNALITAKELAKESDWAESYLVSLDFFNSERNNNSWDFLSSNEQDELALLRMESVIKVLNLFNICEKDENGNWQLIDSCKNVFEREMISLLNYISPSSVKLNDEERNKLQEKYEEFYDRISFLLYELFYSSLEEAMSLIPHKSSSDDTFGAFDSYFNAYIKLHGIALKSFGSYAPRYLINISYNKYFNKAETLIAEKTLEKVIVIGEEINELMPDFPYTSNSEIGYMYIQAHVLSDFALSFCENTNSENIEKKELRLKILKCCTAVTCDFLNSIYVVNGQQISLCVSETLYNEYYNQIQDYVKEIQFYEPDFPNPEVNEERFSTMRENSSGCYIATAVYGSYDCPQVCTLRRFRDNVLDKTWYGKIFIKIYYAISPALVNLFGNTTWFKIMWKSKLDCLVEKLQSMDIESTPYIDKTLK